MKLPSAASPEEVLRTISYMISLTSARRQVLNSAWLAILSSLRQPEDMRLHG